MTEQKLIEHWIQGCAVQRVMFRDGLVLNLEDYNELVISAPIRLTLPATATSPVEVVSVDPNDPAAQLRPLFDFSGATCTDVTWDDAGDLHVEFSDGIKSTCRPTMTPLLGSCTANTTGMPPACLTARCGSSGTTLRTTARTSAAQRGHAWIGPCRARQRFTWQHLRTRSGT